MIFDGVSSLQLRLDIVNMEYVCMVHSCYGDFTAGVCWHFGPTWRQPWELIQHLFGNQLRVL